MHRATPEFWQRFDSLQEAVQKAARKNFQLLKQDNRHPSLHFKKIGEFWSARVDANHRALAVEDAGDFIWVWIGAHDEYERIINKR